MAAETGKEKVVSVLIERQPDVVATNIVTAFFSATKQGRECVVLALMPYMQHAFDVDEDQTSREALCSIVSDMERYGLSQLCAFFMVSHNPLGMMLTVFELLDEKTNEEHLNEASGAKERATLVSTMANGFLKAIDSFDRALVDRVFSLPASYTPTRKVSILDLALAVQCQPVLASPEVERLCDTRWDKYSLSALHLHNVSAYWNVFTDVLTSPVLKLTIDMVSYFLFLLLLGQLQPLNVNPNNRAHSPRAGTVCLLLAATSFTPSFVALWFVGVRLIKKIGTKSGMLSLGL